MTRLFVPGRIEVLGKHTDYAGGRSLLAAVDRGFTVDVAPADDNQITVVGTGPDDSVAVAVPPDDDADRGAGPATAGSALPGDPAWAVYPRTVVHRLARDFPGRLTGCRIELTSDLPSAAGLSSSSALITALFLAVDAVCDIAGTEGYRRSIPDRVALAAYLGAVERGGPFPGLGEGGGGVGTRGGSEDHVAILCAEPGALVQYAFEPVRYEQTVPAPPDHRFVVAASGVRAAKAGSAKARYNRLSDLASRAAALWREATGGDLSSLGAILRRVGLDDALQAILGEAEPGERPDIEQRVRHFAIESQDLVPAAASALAEGALDRFGHAVDRSQALAEELLGNQVPETVHLARTARDLGAVAASAFGAGFGGSVWALVPAGRADRFTANWRDRYRSAFPARARHAAFFATPAAPPAGTR